MKIGVIGSGAVGSPQETLVVLTAVPTSVSAQAAKAILLRLSRSSITGVSNRTHAALVTLIVLLLATAARAQVVGAILTGTITDPSGAAVVSATVSIRNVETGIATVTRTNEAGIYSAPNLLPGEYIVSTEASGLMSGELPALTLSVGAKEILNVRMGLAAVAQTVDVHAGVGAVELGTSAISHVVDGRAARELPFNGRDWS